MRTFKNEIIDCFPTNERGIAIPLNIDIDGTIILHGYDCSEEDFKINGDVAKILNRWVEKYNCTINIYTTREGEKLEEAKRIFERYGIPYHSVGGNQQQKRWTSSNKQYGFVIDDMSAVDVFYDENGRAFVNWESIVKVFEPRLEYMHKLIQEIENEQDTCLKSCVVQRTVRAT